MPRPAALDPLFRSLHSIKGVGPQLSALLTRFFGVAEGQEAIALGLQSALTKDDNVISSYRCHALQYIRGDSVKRIVGELFGFELVRFVPTRMSTPALAVPLGPCAPLT